MYAALQGMVHESHVAAAVEAAYEPDQQFLQTDEPADAHVPGGNEVE